MSNYVQLDQASRQVGKSEVTLRRLIKAGKVSHKKEKTLTGFLYLVDPAEVLKFYGEGGSVADLPEDTDSEPIKTKQIKVAVAGESGGLNEYWQKRAETFEQRYQQALESQSQLREELGVWRGRAEQAQSMLVKFLPGGTEPDPKEQKKNQSQGNWIIATLGIIAGVLVVGVVFVGYTLSR